LLVNQVRIEQTRLELDHLALESDNWVAARQKRDRSQQYHSALANLKILMTDCLQRLKEELDGIADDGGTTDVYSACRKLDTSLILVRRVWTFFRTKFEQRDDPVLGPALAAADEVVWSCYADAFQNAGQPRQAAPLPYIEPAYSPQAVPRADPPSDLRGDSALLQEFLQTLPIPVVSLPPTCVRSPWWLVYLGHEVGHHIQYDLLPQAQLVGEFGQLLASAFPDDEEAAARWESWGREIFADLYSVCLMGPRAVWAMAALELAGERDLMVSRIGKATYPPAVVRLGLLAAAADALEVDGAAELSALGIDPQKVVTGQPLIEKGRDLRALAWADLAHVPRVMKVLTDHPGHGGLAWFKKISGWTGKPDFGNGGTVDTWGGVLRKEKKPDAQKTRRAISCGLLVLGEDRLRLGDVPLVVVQAEPAESLDHVDSDREQAAFLRSYAAQLFAAGAQVVLLLPQLTPELAEEALNRLAESLRSPEPSAPDEPRTLTKPDLPRLLEVVRTIQQTIREGKTVAAKGTDVLEESRKELALEVCLFMHPAAPVSSRTGTASLLSWIFGALKSPTAKGADQLVTRIPRERADLPYADQPLEPDRTYFRLWLSGMSLARDRRWFREWLPAVYAAAKLRFGDREGATFSRFFQPPPQDGSGRGGGGLLNITLTELIPYRGGSIDIQLALLALPGSDAVKVAADLLQDVCRLVTPPLERALPLAELVANHTQKLLAATSPRIHLGLNLGLQQGVGPGYYAVVNAPKERVNADGLFVRNDAMLYASGPGQTPAPLTDLDYLLFRLEVREGRDDWALLDIDAPLVLAAEAILKGDLDAYKQYSRQAVFAALRLPDLTAADRRRVARALQEELNEAKAAYSAGGLEFGATTANLTLNSIMSRASRT
jgi:hypothetical protein